MANDTIAKITLPPGTTYDIKDNEAVANITRDGVIFTATRRDGTHFTFTQSVSYEDLEDVPDLFDGEYDSLTQRPFTVIKNNVYEEVEPEGTENPTEEQWYELTEDEEHNEIYVLTEDETVIEGKQYYKLFIVPVYASADMDLRA